MTDKKKERIVVIVSGGMDSVTLVHYMLSLNYNVTMVSFDYGQKHKKELVFARELAREKNLNHVVVDLSSLGVHLASALTSPDLDVPEGHYAADNMKATVVPNRNMIMISIAGGIAVAEGAVGVATGIHHGDHAIYPDCRDSFRNSIEDTLKLANEGFIDPCFTVFAPFVTIGKEGIVSIGTGLNVNFARTWSCYKGGELHCGRCGTCVERIEAFEMAGVDDPTEYEQREVKV
jgi:7-cyano-7-deazaguanine synthase